jgi:Protein of unknown function (DUF3990)
VPLPGIPAWIDQDIVLYHGTTDARVRDILNAVNETRGSQLSDFGRGFYTTTRRDKAVDWANVNARRTGTVAAVIEFTVSRNVLASLDCLFFIRGDQQAVDYWSFVQYCRTIGGDHNRAHTPRYDLVVGPVTGTWKRQTIIPDTDQISFHTLAGTPLLDNSGKAQVA